MNGQGRTASFSTGAFEVRTPTAQSMQVGAGTVGFKPRSVLDTLQPSGSGYSAGDKARLYKGGRLPSINGRSVATDSKAQWLDSPFRTFG